MALRSIEPATFRYEVDGTPGTSGEMPGAFVAWVVADGTAGTPAQEMRIDNAGSPFFPLHGTTASAANMFLDSGSSPVGEVLRSTSSHDYKALLGDVADSTSCGL
jgi:hypothetical protein